MCGIVALTASHSCDHSGAEAALELIKHRGPDDFGYYYSKDRHTFLGHRRLAILDTSARGKQPMQDHSGRFCVVYNGEIYNFRELREGLESKCGRINWRTNTDTEVLIEGFARLGTDFLRKLNGMFSLVIHDSQTNQVFALRDPLGIKPLYFTTQKGGTYFCSELAGLNAFRDLARTIRKQSILDLVSLTYVCEPYTVYEEFYKAVPGQLYTYRHGEKTNEEALFSHLEQKLDLSRLSSADIIEAYADRFSSAVKRQLIADVPVSLFLSGGLDSSAIAFEMARSTTLPCTAFTIDILADEAILDKQGDDYRHAKILARELGIDLTSVLVQQNALARLPEILAHSDGEFADPAAINTFLICGVAKEKGIKVMLSGQGADEFLAGYRRYNAEQLYSLMPKPLLTRLSGLAGLFPKKMPGLLNALNRRATRFFSSMSDNMIDRLLRLYTWGNPQQLKQLFSDSDGLEIGKELKGTFMASHQSGKNNIESMMKVDQIFDLRSLNLLYTDKMSMAHGIEVRVPFLDLDLLQFTKSLPLNYLLRGPSSKYVLRRAMEKNLPNIIRKRAKTGFYLPIRSWVSKKNSLIMDHLLSEDDVFDKSTVIRMLEEQESGAADHSYPLFGVFCWKLWSAQHDVSR